MATEEAPPTVCWHMAIGGYVVTTARARDGPGAAEPEEPASTD